MAARYILLSAGRADCAAAASCRCAWSGCDRCSAGWSMRFLRVRRCRPMRRSRALRIRLSSSLALREVLVSRQYCRPLRRFLLVRAVEGGCDLLHKAGHFVLHLLVRLEAHVEIENHFRESG